VPLSTSLLLDDELNDAMQEQEDPLMDAVPDANEH
jgi:hypothetical protein